MTNGSRTLPLNPKYSTREQPANANQIIYLRNVTTCPRECNYLFMFTFLSLMQDITFTQFGCRQSSCILNYMHKFSLDRMVG